MPVRLYAGIDQGTTGTRTSLFDEKGVCRSSAYRASTTSHPRPGWDEQNAEELLTAIKATLHEALEAIPGAELGGIGLANQGESIVAFDRRDGRPLSPAILWSDRRGAPLVEEVAATPEAAYIEDRTGLPLDPYFSASKLAWLLRNSERVREASSAGRLALGTLDSFFIFRLSDGAVFATDPSTASRTQLMDIERRRFDSACASAYRIDLDLLPEIGPTVLGEPVPSALGAPLYATVCDQQAALAAIGAVAPGELKVTYGTGCFIEANVGARAVRPDNGLMATFGWETANGDLAWAIEGGVFTGAAAVNWLVSLGLARDPGAVDRLAAQGSASSEALFLPSLTGVGAPWWRPGAAGVFAGLRASTTAADLARAVLGGIAHRVADVLAAVAREQELPDEIRVDGGLSASGSLLQLQADLCGKPIVAAREREGTASGAAGFAAIGAGELDLAGLARRARFMPAVEPRLDEAVRDELRARWERFIRGSAAIDPDRLGAIGAPA